MRIACPFCGDRDIGEFLYRGDARPVLPASDGDHHAYVYLRENPAGLIEEHWYHARGCRSWLVISRDTRTHEMVAARLAVEAGR